MSEREQDYVREWGEYVGERGWRVRERESMREEGEYDRELGGV